MILFPSLSSAQNNNQDSTLLETQNDSLPRKAKKKVKKPKKELNLMSKAMLWSLIPGAGQIYLSKHSNRPKWIGRNPWVWKLPIIYGGLGASAYFIYKNEKERKDFRAAYTERNEAGNVNSPLPGEGENTLYLDGEALITQQSQYQNWRDLSIFIFIGVYLLNIVDAGVQAHFCKFDISPDLTLSVEPAMPSFNSFGAGIKLNFK